MAYNCTAFNGFAIGGAVKQNAILLLRFRKILRKDIGVHNAQRGNQANIDTF